MAYLDAQNLLSGSISAANVLTGQTVTGTNTSVVSTNAIDTTGGTPQAQALDLGSGREIDFIFQVTTSFAGATSIEFQVISADDTALTTNVTVLASSGAIVIASLTAGKQIEVCLPQGAPRTIRRYVGVRYTIVGTGSAGAVVAYTGLDVANVPPIYGASGFSIA